MSSGGIRHSARWAVQHVRLLVKDDRGQDLIEYALLTAAIGLAGAATWPIIVNTIGTTYRALDTNTQGLWEPPPPSGGG